MAALTEAWSAAEIDELLAFLVAWLGPNRPTSAEYAGRLATYFRNNFDLIFAADVQGRRIAIEITPRGQVMIDRLPPFKV